MKIVVETPFKIDNDADKHIKEKLNSLAEFRMGITQADLYFKIDDGEVNKVAVAEIELHKPGNTIFASSGDKDYKKAFTEAFNKAKKQLLKQKEQLKSHH